MHIAEIPFLILFCVLLIFACVFDRLLARVFLPLAIRFQVLDKDFDCDGFLWKSATLNDNLTHFVSEAITDIMEEVHAG